MSVADILAKAEVQHERLKQSNVSLTRSVLSRLSVVNVLPPREKTSIKSVHSSQSIGQQSEAPQRVKHRRMSGLVFTFKTTVEKSDCNAWKTMHGGCVASLFNLAGKIAVASLVPGRPCITTTDITINYIAPAKLGSGIYIQCECVKMGRSLAFLSSKIWDSSHQLLYYATQTVAIEN
ncbi:Acyl-coenzyme A thioesterase 13 [Mycoemilia scoparia]|uniref:Acyl-coenzyme A thioesterase 13 n=1 Tax=Mycoemilia scoparia TaxID=417184 RepID=A0A9W8A3H6_9FUNG|nr:Acyl-coenzyme A thioesterase 13 [Mycoemilia scoparia]